MRFAEGEVVMKAEVMVTFLFLCVAAVWALPKKDLKPSEILLRNLSPERLESLLESRLEELQEDIVKSYEDQLREHETNVENLHRYRRDTAAYYDHNTPSSSNTGPQYWHSYAYDTEIGNRERLEIEDITIKHHLGDIEIINVFPLNLWNFSAIYQSDDHIGHVLVKGKLEAVKVRNQWTKSLTGCPCLDDHSKNCACCESDGCLCQTASDTCVQCGLDYVQHFCDANRPRLLELDSAVGFQYYLDYYDPVAGLQRVIVTSRDTTVSFYKIDEDSAQPMQAENGLGTINFARPVTHLGYGETYKDFHGIIKKDRFLITFRADESTQQFHGINIDSTGMASGMSELWQASGTEMKVWQSGGRVMVAVLNVTILHVYELKANQWYEYQVRACRT
ncbi:uncharacterized protein [Panulirus ornatus]|uniref:uncharacterized protein n=1 Tax=Panulirus ornatus TaxID=150431 RepID=UPI003A838D61